MAGKFVRHIGVWAYALQELYEEDIYNTTLFDVVPVIDRHSIDLARYLHQQLTRGIEAMASAVLNSPLAEFPKAQPPAAPVATRSRLDSDPLIDAVFRLPDSSHAALRFTGQLLHGYMALCERVEQLLGYSVERRAPRSIGSDAAMPPRSEREIWKPLEAVSIESLVLIGFSNVRVEAAPDDPYPDVSAGPGVPEVAIHTKQIGPRSVTAVTCVEPGAPGVVVIRIGNNSNISKLSLVLFDCRRTQVTGFPVTDIVVESTHPPKGEEITSTVLVDAATASLTCVDSNPNFILGSEYAVLAAKGHSHPQISTPGELLVLLDPLVETSDGYMRPAVSGLAGSWRIPSGVNRAAVDLAPYIAPLQGRFLDL